MAADNLFNQDEINALREGQTVSKSLQDTSQGLMQHQASIVSDSSPDVSGWSQGSTPDIQSVKPHVSQPNITAPDGSVIERKKVTGPSKGFAEALGREEIIRRANEETRHMEEAAELRKRRPDVMADRIAYLERQLKKLTTKVNRLTKEEQKDEQ